MFLHLFTRSVSLVLVLRSAPVRTKDFREASGGNMAGFQSERLVGQCCLVLVSRAPNVDNTAFVFLEKIKQFFNLSFSFSFLPYFFIWRVYCFFVELLFLSFYIVPCLISSSTFCVFVFCFVWFFYKKQTGPMSTPNSWLAPPMSMGAMSTMGSRVVF